MFYVNAAIIQNLVQDPYKRKRASSGLELIFFTCVSAAAR